MNALLQHLWGRSRAQDRVWAHVSGLAPGKAVQRWLMSLTFQAFIDESQSNEEIVLGGYIATAATWAEFANDWEKLLPLGLRAKNGNLHFKMSEMAATPERMERVPLFYAVIEKYELMPISARLNLGDFARAHKRFDNFLLRMNWTINNKGLWTNPYFFCFTILVNGFHVNREKYAPTLPLTEKVDFIFDDRTEKRPILAGWELSAARRTEELAQYYGATPRFENDQEFLPLQAADFWAWCRMVRRRC